MGEVERFTEEIKSSDRKEKNSQENERILP
jgi:hypothetical protein